MNMPTIEELREQATSLWFPNSPAKSYDSAEPQVKKSIDRVVQALQDARDQGAAREAQFATTANGTEYRVEVLFSRNNDVWVGVNGTSYGSKESALEKLTELGPHYGRNDIPLRIAERSLGAWKASTTPTEEAVQRATRLLDPNTRDWAVKTEDKVLSVEIKVDDLRLILDKLKETK